MRGVEEACQARRSRSGCGAGQQHLPCERGVHLRRSVAPVRGGVRAGRSGGHGASEFRASCAIGPARSTAVCGESDKAIAQCEAACRMNPLDSKKAATATFTPRRPHFTSRAASRSASAAGRRALALAPQDNIARKYVAMSLGQLGRTRRGAGRDRRARQATSPMLRSHSSASKASATNGCTSCIWRACARRDCGKNSRGETFGVALCLVAQPPYLMLHSHFVSVGSQADVSAPLARRPLCPRKQTSSPRTSDCP